MADIEMLPLCWLAAVITGGYFVLDNPGDCVSLHVVYSLIYHHLDERRDIGIVKR